MSVRSLIPRRVKVFIKKFLGRSVPDFIGGKYFCPVCSNHVKYFLPIQKEYLDTLKKYEYVYKLDESETLNYSNYLCPSCYSNDRDRLFALFYDSRLKKKAKFSFLDFAPAWPIANFFKSKENINYRTADLFSKKVDDKGVDICNMTLYKDNTFDFLICSHVLEHVVDPDKALQELYRVLKPGGSGILLVPIILKLESTQEDLTIKDEALRWKYYGQGDHLRMFAKSDFMNRIKRVGFKLTEIKGAEFEAYGCEKNGVAKESVLYYVEK